jgi:hypothetical protein
MEPSRDTRSTLVDLLDRILDKGLVINADLIISVAGIPLLGVNLKAALAGMETMLKYGVMQDWDQKTRAWESEHRKKTLSFLVENESVELKIYGSYDYNKGIYQAWKPGYLYLTNKKLVHYRQDFEEVTFQISLEEINAWTVNEEELFDSDKKKHIMSLLDKEGQVHRISTVYMDQLEEALNQKMKEKGLTTGKKLEIHEEEKEPILCAFLSEEEKIIHRGNERIWYLVPAEGILQETWRPGHLFLTDRRLLWWSDFDKKIVYDCSVDKIREISMETGKANGLNSKNEKVLLITSRHNHDAELISSFSAGIAEIDEWEKILVNQLSCQEEEMETCPECGKDFPVKELLEKGCPSCGWKSPLLKNGEQGITAG